MDRYLQFSNVGRRKYSGKKLLHPEIKTPDDIANVAYQEAKKHLMSRGVECVFDSEKNEGHVFAGFRSVGTFAIAKC